MISKETQSKLIASRIIFVSEPITNDKFWNVGIVFFTILALANIFLWS